MTAPGPPVLGRGVVVADGAAPPAPWADAPVIVVDDEVLARPAAAVTTLHEAWAARRRHTHLLDGARLLLWAGGTPLTEITALGSPPRSGRP